MDKTYTRLIETGIKLFGQHGFDTVSVRDIVKDSGANLSAVSYHFGGKEELYKAVIEYLTTDLRTSLATLDAAAFSSLDLPEMKIRLREIIIAFSNMFNTDYGISRLNIFVRETTSPDVHLSHQYFTNMIETVRTFFQQILIAYYVKLGESTDKVSFVIALIFAMLKNKTQSRSLPGVSDNEREDTFERLISLIITSKLE